MKVLKWIGISLGALVGLVALALIGLLIYGQVMFKRTFADRPLYPIVADTSPAGLARGEYLVRNVMACADCHSQGGPDGALSGHFEEVAQGPISAVVAFPNLTPDVETGLGSWTDAEIARAIREGVDKDGVSLVIMPANNYHVMSDQDVASIIGYLRSLEPVNNPIPPLTGNAVAKVMSAFGMLGPVSLGEPITEPQSAPAAGTVEYGAYLVALGGCRDCHREDLTGGPIPFSDEGTPPASNLTPGGELVGWSEADFVAAIQTGKKPSGVLLDEAMPWKVYSRMTGEDLAAMYQYLKVLPSKVAGK